MYKALSDWQQNCKTVVARSKHLFINDHWTDCSFLVGLEPNRQLIRGHKLLLAMASPVFDAMFYGSMSQKNQEIEITDMQPDIFKALLTYIYTEDVNITSFDMAFELCYGAKKYILPSLAKMCIYYMWSNLSTPNICKGYEYGKLLDDTDLMDECIQIISKTTKEILADSSFVEIHGSTLIKVFSLDHMTIESELDLFGALERYAKARDKEAAPRGQMSLVNNDETVSIPRVDQSSEQSALSLAVVDGDDEEDAKHKKTIKEALRNIRFLTLTPQQFAEGPARSSLLTEQDIFKIVINISTTTPNLMMPSEFSICRNLREKPIMVNGPIDINKLYCLRPCLTEGFVSTAVFQVDHDILMHGFRVMRSKIGYNGKIEDEVNVELIDPTGRAHHKEFKCSADSTYLDFIFKSSLFIHRNKNHTLNVNFKMNSEIFIANAVSRQVNSEDVVFQFKDSGRNDFIQGLIFTC